VNMVDYAEAQQSYRTTLQRFMMVGFCALIGVIISATVLLAQDRIASGWIGHTFQVQSAIADIRLETARLAAYSRAAHDPARTGGIDPARGRLIKTQLRAAAGRLAQMTHDNPRAVARMLVLNALITDAQSLADRRIALDDQADLINPDPTGRISRLCDSMSGEEDHLLAMRRADRAQIEKDFYLVLALTGLLLILVGTLATTSIVSYTREISASRQALRDAHDGLELAVQERTTELRRANSEIQRFAYIVSHDLRSPLVNVLGFTAELEAATHVLREALDRAEAARPDTIDPRARTAITEDMPEALHFIRTSTQKMDRLINAILELSRLGRRPIRPRSLDLAAICRAVADTLHVQLAEAHGTLELVEPMAKLVSDPVAIEQFVANLVENAIKYRHTARPPVIRISARREGEHVAIAVADNGRGIDPRDHERVFDLFRRSGRQDQPGEGIGLAHVRALAHRLGGTVSVESQFGAGSTFTVTLPAYFSEDQDFTA
jgi:signal transduction histidine kinase